jgi:hypothetical protein
MTDTIDDLLAHAELVIVGNNDPAFLAALQPSDRARPIVDIAGVCQPLSATHANYEGICW